MSYRLVDCLLAGTRWNESSISCPLASSQLTCMTYTWCCLYSLELLMMDGKTETCRVIFNKLENCASGWFYCRNISRCKVRWTHERKSRQYYGMCIKYSCNVLSALCTTSDLLPKLYGSCPCMLCTVFHVPFTHNTSHLTLPKDLETRNVFLSIINI